MFYDFILFLFFFYFHECFYIYFKYHVLHNNQNTNDCTKYYSGYVEVYNLANIYLRNARTTVKQSGKQKNPVGFCLF